MKDIELPALPAYTKVEGWSSMSFGVNGGKEIDDHTVKTPYYSADQMRSYGQECVRLERERCITKE